MAVGAAYIGTFNRNLPFGRDVNYPVVTPTATDAAANVLARRPNTAFGAVTMLDSDQYVGLQRPAAHVQHAPVAQRQLQRVLHLQPDHDERAAAEQHHAGPARRTTPSSADEYGRADTDQRHVFSMNLNWELDYYKGGNGVLARAPQRLEHLADHQAAQRPAVHRDQRQRRRQPRRPDQRPGAADRRPAPRQPDGGACGSTRRPSSRTRSSRASPVDGNSPRNSARRARASASSTWRSRATSGCPKGKLTFRAEATNAFNIVNLGQPGASVPSGATSTTFGVIRSARAMRQVQLGVRWTF